MSSDDFLESYRELMKWMRSRILSESSPETLLNLATFYGEIRWYNFDGTYHDDEIEQHVADTIFRDPTFQVSVNPGTKQHTVLIASELYDYGGHSRVVRNWLKSFRGDFSHSLLITRSVTKRFEDSLKANGYSYHLCSARGVELVTEIIRRCGDARRIVLHTHPNDIFAATAAKYLAHAGREIVFFNHADHVFSYGISSANVVCEVSSYGIALNRRTRRTDKSCYLGIPIDIAPATSNSSSKSASESQIVLTCGSSYKYRPAAMFFGDFIDRLLLHRPDVNIMLIGPTGTEPWWQGHEARWGNSVRFMGEVPHDQYLEAVASAAVYVDSFPMPGGTAFPEALLNGKQVAGLQNPLQGYSPADVLRVDSIDGLVRRAVDLLAGDAMAAKEIEHARVKASEAHCLNGFRNRVLAIYEGNRESCPWDVKVDTRWLETAWRAAANLNQVETPRLFDLPVAFCLGFLARLYRFHKAQRSKFAAFAINRLFLRSLPASFRNRVISLREVKLGEKSRGKAKQ